MKIRIEIEADTAEEYASAVRALGLGTRADSPPGERQIVLVKEPTAGLPVGTLPVTEFNFGPNDGARPPEQTSAPAPQQEAKPRGRGRPPKDQAEAHATVSTPAPPAVAEVSAPGTDVRAKLLAATAGEVKYETMADVVKTIMLAKSASAAQGAIFEATGGAVGSLASFKDNKAAWPELFDKLVAWCEKEGVAL